MEDYCMPRLSNYEKETQMLLNERGIISTNKLSTKYFFHVFNLTKMTTSTGKSILNLVSKGGIVVEKVTK